ncbi:CobW family GTP-binding protein [[Clostridium] symbiosum]|uniref:CobW/P47K family protein n=1 Tax=[Clostridium] symbiosum ATCC 14940 TaxID=411472 RepID=A0ABC9TXS0_CLOSY|nr:CobW family GTP-binding protein [[Clostridium] symbiosum]ERI76861.1 CobW/P47K family protein [[Clostridium] symbiosum ATCC 14940]MDB2034574.1 CobW family GTP-binding protein [[Clostridium] symbiosum]SUY57828.1 Putative GTPases (G3E family) [[Clostridium] symbiosum]
MTKIDIISGFLGAGKTTFIKQLLKEAISGEKVVLIENEFGEIGIDGGFLRDAGIEIREMNSGCICCSLVGDFGKSLEEVLTKYHPDRVIIEPSGVGKLSDVMKAVRDVASEIEVMLNSAVTVVDVNKCRMYMKNFGEFFNNQIENAGTIILSRTDIAGADKVKAAVAMLREHNADANIVTTPCSQLTGAQLLEIIEKKDDMAEELMREAREHKHAHSHHHDQEHGEECGCHAHGHHHEHHHEGGHDGECNCGCHEHEHDHHHGHDHGEECGCQAHDHDHAHDHDYHNHDHDESCTCGCHDHDHHHAHDHGHHHADEVFTSWGRENVSAISRDKLEAVLKELAYGQKYGQVLRAKGMIPGEKEGVWIHFDLVPEQIEIREGSPDYTGKLCVIGANLDEEGLAEAFNA